MSRSPVLVIAGCTATGKTAAALHLARALGGELVGADSVQVYRGFDIGSAKPTPNELADTTHHLIDVLDPNQTIDAMAYAAQADRAIEAIAGRGNLPIVVGGTGLWLRALVRGLVDVPLPDPAIRGALRGRSGGGGFARPPRTPDDDRPAGRRSHPSERHPAHRPSTGGPSRRPVAR